MSEIRFTDYSELLPSRKSYRNVGNIEIDGIPIQEDIKQIRADAIDECIGILQSAIAEDGQTKCTVYLKALNEMEQIKEQTE